MSRNILFTVASLMAMFFYMVGARELCGAVNPPAGLAETHRIMQQNERTKAYRKRSTFTVDLYIHSIERTTVAEVATDAMIQNQVCPSKNQARRLLRQNLIIIMMIDKRAPIFIRSIRHLL
jgi:tyrosyl-tRNA synthetase